MAAGPRAGDPARRAERSVARRVARTHLHREQALPAHRGQQEPRGGLRRRGQGTGAVQETAPSRGDALRRAAAYGAEVHPYFALRQRQGRQRNPPDRGGHQVHAVRSGPSYRICRSLLRAYPRQVRQGPGAQDRTARIRQYRSHEGRRDQRQALRGPRRRLLRHRQVDEGRRAGLRLLGHRRRDRLHQGRPLRHHQGQRQGLLREGHLLYRRLQAQRRAHDLQRAVPRRQERPDHDEALRHQGHHARQGVRHHQGHAQERDTLYVCQSER